MPDLSRDTIRSNARRFSSDWAGTTSERGDSQTFWVRWFEVFGLRREHVAVFEESGLTIIDLDPLHQIERRHGVMLSRYYIGGHSLSVSFDSFPNSPPNSPNGA